MSGLITEYSLLYGLACFTFLSIYAMVFIKNKLIFFEKKRVPCARPPSPILGNIRDVLNHETALFFHLWKYYNRFRRKNYKAGGLQFFLRPVLLLVDSRIISKMLSEHFEDVLQVNKFEGRSFEGLLKKFQGFESDFVALQPGGVVRVNEVFTELYTNWMLTLMGLKNDLILNKSLKRASGDLSKKSFFEYLTLCYPIFEYFQRPLNEITVLHSALLKSQELRKKNDVLSEDFLHNDLSSEELLEMLETCSKNLSKTTSSLIYCLVELSFNKDIQDELIGEVRRFRKEFPALNLQDLNGFVYLDTIIKETFRMYPPEGVILKKCHGPYQILDENLVLPRDFFLLISTYGIHHDPNNYANPETFDPDRFSEENRLFVKTDSFLPFGQHKTTDFECQLTSLLVKLAVILVFSNYRVSFERSSRNRPGFHKSSVHPQPNEDVSLVFERID